MGTKTSPKILKSLYLNKRVRYTKKGSRFGWEGVVTSVCQRTNKTSAKRFTVLFDNGVEQSYRMDALHYEPKSWGAHETYIELIKEET